MSRNEDRDDGRNLEVVGMTDKELEENLVTLDYRGREFKAKALVEVRRRAWNLGIMGCKLDFMEK